MSVTIKATGLKKSYGDFEAVKGVDFEIESGKCTGLLGPNGAGKTTTMRMIMGLTTMSDGALTIFDEPASGMGREAKSRIGLVPQEDNLDPDLSVTQNLMVYGRYFGLKKDALAKRVPQLLDYMKIQEKADNRVSQLSGGMKRRLVIARSMINDPELIILDEPTTGLDPQARVMIWQRLQDLKKENKTMLLTTHYMDEAQRLCDKIIVIDHGEILDVGTPNELIERHVKNHVFEVPKPLPKPLKGKGFDMEDIGESVLFYVDKPEEIRDACKGCDYLHRPSNLEDVFLRLTGRTLRDV